MDGTGNALGNIIIGNAKANTLDGAGGGDTMRGIGGSDTYVVRSANDVVDESVAGSGGTDTILAHLDFSLAAASAGRKPDADRRSRNGTGNGITGNAVPIRWTVRRRRTAGGGTRPTSWRLGDIVHESAAGSAASPPSVNIDSAPARQMVGRRRDRAGAIENIIRGGNAIEATGNDLAITGNAGGNVLDGGDGADSIFGEAGDDRLIGGLGPDLLTGGNGLDSFAFEGIGDSGKRASARDTILDFSAEDFIDLSAIDAKKGGGDSHFKFIRKQGFHDKKGELHYQKKSW